MIALLIGVALGTIAGYYGGLIDSVVSRITELFMSFPLLLLVIALGQTVADRFESVTDRRAVPAGRARDRSRDRALLLVLPRARRPNARRLAAGAGVRRGSAHGRRPRRSRDPA